MTSIARAALLIVTFAAAATVLRAQESRPLPSPEAVFKAVGRALADATRLNPRIAGILPSTKGAL